LGSSRLEERSFFSSGLSRMDTGLSMQVLLGATEGGREGGGGGGGREDLFSFQPIGGSKVPCFYSF